MLPSVLTAAAIGIAYLIVAPVSADLAAAVFRADLFAEHGFLAFNTAWYGGHHVPAYSLLMPPLGALLGVRLMAVLAAVAAAGLFAALVERAYPQRNVLLGSLWFAVGVSLQLLTGRMAFLVGFAIALGALVAAQRDRRWAAVVLAFVTPLASPVAAAFLALAGVAWTLGARRRLGLVLAAVAVAPVMVLNALFPEGGSEPFVASAYWPGALGIVALGLGLPREERVLRAGAALCVIGTTICFVFATPVGGNITRLAALTAGPIAAILLWPQRRWLLALITLPLLYWQLMPAIRDAAFAEGDPSTEAAYYAPLVDRLAQEPGPMRVEVPFTRRHWEARHLAEHVPLARGWQRQLDRERNPLFYDDDEPLTPERYTDWLHENAVSFVALPDAALDESAEAEAELIREGVPGLEPVWRDEHWTLYRVRDAEPLGVTAMGADRFTVRAERAGQEIVARVHFSPHWAVVSGAGCVSEAPGGFTRVRALRAGDIEVAPRVDAGRALLGRTGERCDANGG